MPEKRILLEHAADDAYLTVEGYRRTGGFEAFSGALKGERQAIIDAVKASGLRGRGGAGFPTWIKWNGIPKQKTGPTYILCNADEGEPGTFKDKELMERCPFLTIEGMALAGFATQSEIGYVYVRGEFMDGAKAMRRAIDEAYAAGLLGKNIQGSGFDFDL